MKRMSGSSGCSKDLRMKESREQPGGRMMDSRQVQCLEEILEPSIRFGKRHQQQSSKHGRQTASTFASSVATTPNTAEVNMATNVLFDDVHKKGEEEDANDYEASDDIRDIESVEHLVDYHPRARENGAGYLRNVEQKRFAAKLGSEDWHHVHERVIHLGVVLAKQIRIRFEKKYEKMNAKNIFHPDANKVRMDAQLQVEYRRELSYENLECLVLQEMINHENMLHAPSNEKDKHELAQTFNKRKNRRGGAAIPTSPPMDSEDADKNDNGKHKNQEGEEVTGDGEDQDAKEDLENLFKSPDKPILSFDEYKQKVQDTRNRQKLKKMAESSSAKPIDDFMKVRHLGTRASMMRLRQPRPGVPVGKQQPRKCQGRRRNEEGAASPVAGTEQGLCESDSASETEKNEFSIVTEPWEGSMDEYSLSSEQSDSRMTPSSRRKAARSRRMNRKKSQNDSKGNENQMPELYQQILDIFDLFEMPPSIRLDMMIKYTDPKLAMSLPNILHDWREAWKIISLYEDLLEVLRSCYEGLISANDPQHAFSEDMIDCLEEIGCYLDMSQMFGASSTTYVQAHVDKVGAVCRQVLENVETRWEDVITYRGQQYRKLRFNKNNEHTIEKMKYGSSPVLSRMNHILLRK